MAELLNVTIDHAGYSGKKADVIKNVTLVGYDAHLFGRSRSTFSIA